MSTLAHFDEKAAELRAIAVGLAAAPAPAPAPAWPAPIDCLGGTAPATITYPVGEGATLGEIVEPVNSRRLANMPDGSVGVFGDSIILAMPENLIHPAAVNYALGGQTLRRMINGLHNYQFMRTGGAGVILCGVNDLSNTTYYGPRDNGNAVNTVLYMLGNQLRNWLTGKWVVCHLLPRDEPVGGPEAYGHNAQIAAVNAGIENALAGCAAQIAFVPVPPEYKDANGNLQDALHIDGQHGSKALALDYTARIRAALATLGV